MEPGGIASHLLTGGIAFTGVVVIIIVLITAMSYMSNVMGVSSQRTYASGLIVLLLVVGGLIVYFLFPNLARDLYENINRLGYR
jgi:hypothetical protein